MSENKEFNILDKVKELPSVKSEVIASLSNDIRILKNEMSSISERLKARKSVIKENEKAIEDSQNDILVDDSQSENSTSEVIKDSIEDVKQNEEPKVEEKVVEEPKVKVEAKPIEEVKVVEEVKNTTIEKKPQVEKKVEQRPQNEDRKPREFNKNQDNRNFDRRQNNNGNNPRQNNDRDNRQFSNRDNKPFNRDNRDGKGQFNNNRNNVPRLPKADLAPPPIIKENTQKKKKVVEKEDKKALSKKALAKKGYVDSIGYDDEVVRHHKQRKVKKANDFTPNTVVIEHAVVNTDIIPVKMLAEKIGKQSTEIVKKLFLLNQMVTINDSIDFDTAELVAMEFGVTLEYKPNETAEDKLQQIMLENEVEGELVKRPPVVTIMGHVDHGKTSLLDYIRNTKVASGEAGGITQHIGAYTIDVHGEKITFLDTPGHEAFTTMRKRGAMVTDIAVIVVAGDDGIMPQTVEAISHAKEAGVSIMIAITKIDKMTCNVDKIMQQMTQYGLTPEAWGGETMVCKVSAKTGEGVDDLLESIVLLAEVKELKAVKDCRAQGSIIEARLDKGVGPVATCLIQSGTLHVADYVVAGTVVGKVRAMIDTNGKQIKSAGPSEAVSIHGFSDVPNAGDQLIVVKDDKLAKQVAQERANKEREEMQRKSQSRSLEDMFRNYSATEKKNLGVIIKGDVQGSVEAVKQEFIKLGESMADEGVVLTIMHAAVGAINESDIMLADTGNAVVVGFNVRPEAKAKQLADRSGVDIKIYRVIYDAIDDMTKALKGMLDPIYREEVLGHAEVREIFKITGVGTIAGCYVTDGKVARNAKFRLIRDNIVVYDGSISSMKRNKDEAKEVASGYECGIGLEGYNDIKQGDIIEAFILKEEER